MRIRAVHLDRKVIIELTADEAREFGSDIQDAWPLPDMAYYDGAALISAADEIDPSVRPGGEA